MGNAAISQTREDKIISLKSYMDGILPKFMEDGFGTVHGHRHASIPRLSSEIFFISRERDVLLEEGSGSESTTVLSGLFTKSSRKGNSLLQLTYPCEWSSTVS
ncbi:Kinesin motor domain containing protein, expressed [Datura stramonium]|uniref:Kinesin motor domain containing protein, expressed n=1 Tax=Datura stramonium TaxID=4076 RepID=A0ABS8V6B4_DATST|nr:Kinesin motor domain containing protein, expressed [Datura stramonium]